MAFGDFLSLQRDGMKTMATSGVMGLHLVSGPAVGFAIGYGLDVWLEITPWGGISAFFVGIGAGFLNVWRDAKELLAQMDKKSGGAVSGQ